MEKPLWMWAGFFAIVIILMIIDLGVLHRKPREVSLKESIWLSLFYVAIAMAFGLFVWAELGATKANEYLTGYLLEKALSMDNIFVMSLVFSFFAIPRAYRHRVLFWGILGVILLRGIFIGVGAAAVAEFKWILLIFGVFLVYTGAKILISGEEPDPDFSKNRVLKLLRKYLPITTELKENRFFVRQTEPESGRNKLYLTPLFLALVLVELADIMFAVDSIPTIFAITPDPYIIYTSNIFAILGLRAMFFMLDAILYRFEYLKYALSVILMFIGAQVVVEYFHLLEITAGQSLAVTLSLLAGGVILSLIKTKRSA